jgi:hypothetical protein
LYVMAVFLVLSCSTCSKPEGGPGQGKGPGIQETTTKDVQAEKAESVGIEKNKIFSEGVKNVRLVLETTGGQDLLRAVVLDKSDPGEGVTYKYDWTKNGQQAGSGDHISGFKRGDKIAVKITPCEGDIVGRTKTLTTEIRNCTPRVAEQKNITLERNHLSYQITATDPDGDIVTYILVDPPQGMKIDPRNGLLDWVVGPEAQDDYTITVKITDGQGGEILYPLKIHLDKGGSQPGTPAAQKG